MLKSKSFVIAILAIFGLGFIAEEVLAQTRQPVRQAPAKAGGQQARRPANAKAGGQQARRPNNQNQKRGGNAQRQRRTARGATAPATGGGISDATWQLQLASAQMIEGNRPGATGLYFGQTNTTPINGQHVGNTFWCGHNNSSASNCFYDMGSGRFVLVATGGQRINLPSNNRPTARIRIAGGSQPFTGEVFGGTVIRCPDGANCDIAQGATGNRWVRMAASGESFIVPSPHTAFHNTELVPVRFGNPSEHRFITLRVPVNHDVMCRVNDFGMDLGVVNAGCYDQNNTRIVSPHTAFSVSTSSPGAAKPQAVQ
ncbi:MAG: hypothetical protein FWD15_06340 [Alphaproteobacteria bacterium]|nr:hypothetical protein [Alphaproteobacteria bacterium]